MAKWVLVSVLSPLLQTGLCILCLLLPRPCPMAFTPDDNSLRSRVLSRTYVSRPHLAARVVVLFHKMP